MGLLLRRASGDVVAHPNILHHTHPSQIQNMQDSKINYAL